MRWSQSLIPTMREAPEGAEIPSHVLMLRAGLIGQLMAGAYTYLPLGLRALRKAERIVREEMDRAGAVELLMPALTPISLWERSGRLEAFGNVLMQFSVRRQNKQVHLALGPTHEEVVTELVARHVSSYRQLPVTLYQVQTKFRNEERPRFGVLRTSEFLMKDAYSFDVSVEGLNHSYDAMYQAYCRIFDRCGIRYLAVEAESGPIGGDASHEFMVLADNGEDSIVHCQGCGYAANLERAETGKRTAAAPDAAAHKPLTKVDTPHVGSIEQVSKLLKCKPHKMIKTLIYLADGVPAAVLIRGDHEANEGKVRRALGVKKLELAPPEVIEEVTKAPVGFAGPVGLTAPVWADHDIGGMTNAITGANEVDKHYVNVNLQRDFQIAPSDLPICATPRRAIPVRAVARRWSCGMPSRSATSSSWEPSIPPRWRRNLPMPRSNRTRSSWAATASASIASSPRWWKRVTTPTASSGRWPSRRAKSCSRR